MDQSEKYIKKFAKSTILSLNCPLAKRNKTWSTLKILPSTSTFTISCASTSSMGNCKEVLRMKLSSRYAISVFKYFKKDTITNRTDVNIPRLLTSVLKYTVLMNH